MLRNCKECNKVFSHPGSKLCPQCQQLRRDDFDKIKEYLRSNSKATTREVVAATKVQLDRVQEFIREGRLDVLPSDANQQCSICGTPIMRGRVCERCLVQMKVEETPSKPRKSAVEQGREKARIRAFENLRDKRDY